MKRFHEHTPGEKNRIIFKLAAQGWRMTRYYPEEEMGMAKDGIGVFLKDLIIDEGAI